VVDKKIRVINITEEGRYGGPQSRIAKVANLLVDMGVETTVVCSIFDSDIFLNELKKKKIPHIPIRLHRMTLQLGHLVGFVLGFVPEVLVLRKILKNHKHDLIHCNGCWQIKGMIAARLSGTDAEVIYHLNDTRTQPIIKYVFSCFARHWVDAFISSCQRGKDYYLNDEVLRTKKYCIIPPPVNTIQFKSNVVTSWNKIKMLPGLKVITVCNINRGKGLDELIDLCDKMSINYPQQPLSFCVVGPIHKSQAAYFSQLENKIFQKKMTNFHFLGGTNDVASALKAADIFICASHFESGPMTVWEAMSMGKPIVSTDVGDVKIYLKKGQCGFCVPVGDVQAMKEKLSILINDQSTRQEMGKNARIFAVENLDLKICAQKHAFFYKKLVTEKMDLKERGKN